MGSAVDLAGSGCCVAAPSPVTSLSLIGGGVITLLRICGVPGKAPERGRMRLPEQLLSSVSPPGWRAPRCLLALVATTPILCSILLILQ